MKARLMMALVALAACDPVDVMDKAMARTAEAVIVPVVGPLAARCVVENATPEELRAIAVDIGVEAGTRTEANIEAIARRPETVACIAQGALAR